MKAIMVMYDSLNRHMLPNYGCDWTLAPNFRRLGERTVTFDNHYVGSMPCMPARRELHTGRHNFLHRSWGPFEPFDDSTFTILKQNGVYTHLVSDHYHYWEDGGATYHHRYSSWVNVRGQEGDAWKGEVADPEIPEHLGRIARQDWVNRKYMQEERLTPQAQTFAAGLEFLETNRDQDNWYLQIETFDPHEPFFTFKQWKDRYNYDWDGPHFDWPMYERVTEDPGRRGIPALPVRRSLDPMRPLPRHGDRLHGPPRHVEGHHAPGRDRPRLPARRARLVGQGADALVQRDRPHTVLRLGSTHRRGRPATHAA